MLASSGGQTAPRERTVKFRVIAEAQVKTDQIDARVLAERLDCDYLPAIWVRDASAPTRTCGGR
jgi:hypothetical protein